LRLLQGRIGILEVDILIEYVKGYNYCAKIKSFGVIMKEKWVFEVRVFETIPIVTYL